jgi:hypothetical protein
MSLLLLWHRLEEVRKQSSATFTSQSISRDQRVVTRRRNSGPQARKPGPGEPEESEAEFEG